MQLKVTPHLKSKKKLISSEEEIIDEVIAADLDIPWIKMNRFAKLPTYSTEQAAGMDLYTCFKFEIKPGERVTINVGAAPCIPVKFYGKIEDRSGYAHKFGLTVLGGVIDSDFRSGIGVILLNTGNESVFCKRGDRIAQMIIHRYYKSKNHWIKKNQAVKTKRGEKGFGSSGT